MKKKYLCIDNFYYQGKLEAMAGCSYGIEIFHGRDEGYAVLSETESGIDVWTNTEELAMFFDLA